MNDRAELDLLPSQEGWWLCDIKRHDVENRFKVRVLFWKHSHWWFDEDMGHTAGVTVIRFRGPLVLATPPSQTARDIIKKIYAESLRSDDAVALVTAVEQTAFQRGKEEGRREERERCKDKIREVRKKLSHDNFWANACDECIAAVHETDPPAQPAATEPAKLDDRPFGQRLTDLEARVQRLEKKP